MQLPFLTKYKPIYFDDYIGNEDITLFLKALVDNNSCNILFVGNSGSGKTTLINSIIKEYYKDVTESQDMIENNILYINSLKEQGIHYYRNNVKTFCQTTSSIKGKKKFVVLDDLDYINEQSQQVFRNCVDKYSKNVHFVSSCLNMQKVIDSIQSRVFIVRIKPHSQETLKTILNNIAKSEEIKINEKCKKKLLVMSNYSIRILVNYLEKLKLLDKNITEDIIEKICNNICFTDFKDYIKFCSKDNDIVTASQMLLKLYDRGYSVIDILDNFFLYIKTCDEVTEDQKYQIIQVICKYISIFYNVHEDEIELTLFTNSIIKLFEK